MKKKKDKKTSKFSWQKAFGSASSSSSEQHDRRRQQELQQQRQDDSDHHEEEEENELLLSEQPSADTHHSGCSTSVDDRMVRFQKQALESIRTAFQ